MTSQHLRASGRTTSPSRHVWLPGFCCGWPNGLKLPPEQPLGFRCYCRLLQALVENGFVFSIPVQLMCNNVSRPTYTFI